MITRSFIVFLYTATKTRTRSEWETDMERLQEQKLWGRKFGPMKEEQRRAEFVVRLSVRLSVCLSLFLSACDLVSASKPSVVFLWNSVLSSLKKSVEQVRVFFNRLSAVVIRNVHYFVPLLPSFRDRSVYISLQILSNNEFSWKSVQRMRCCS